MKDHDVADLGRATIIGSKVEDDDVSHVQRGLHALAWNPEGRDPGPFAHVTRRALIGVREGLCRWRGFVIRAPTTRADRKAGDHDDKGEQEESARMWLTCDLGSAVSVQALLPAGGRSVEGVLVGR
jgi:hypothetical protein